MKTFFYVVTLLCLSLLMACSEEPPTDINIESLSKKPVPPPSADPLILLDNANQIAGIKTIGQGANHKNIIQVWTYEGGYVQTWELEKDGSYQVCTIGDADNDGQDELLAIYWYETGRRKNKVAHSQLQVFENGATDEPSRFIDVTDNGMWKLVVADANSDGFQEIVGGGREHITVFNDDGTDITQLWQSGSIYDDFIFDLDVGDADNDQQNEIVYAGLTAGKFAVFDYLGGNSWGDKVYSEPITGGLDRAKVADVDGDGQNEIIGGGNYNKLTVWEYTPGEPYEYTIEFESEDLGGFTQGVAAGDFDHDGYSEIAVASSAGGNSVYVFKYENNTYQNKFSETIAHGVDEIFAGDADNDGIDEFVVATVGLLIYDYENGGYSQTQLPGDSFMSSIIIK